MPSLTSNAYGKSQVRLTHVTRDGGHHQLKEVSIDIELRGDFAESYLDGDNRKVVATDTMKNTVYALARHHPLSDIESFGKHLADHFVDGFEQVTAATIHLAEDAWHRIPVDGVPHPTAFVGGSREKRIATVVRDGAAGGVRSGLKDLLVMKTTDSEFAGFPRDRFTTLPEVDDRILATVIAAEWTYADGDHDWSRCFDAIRTAMLETFANHHSLAVQQSLFLMGGAALAACDGISEITLKLPNAHRLLMNLTPFGMDNPNMIFVPTDEPYGLITGTISR
jgi:urate oxidase